MSSRYKVLCHDHQNMIAAEFRKVSDFGAEMAESGDCPNPAFALNSKIFLDILDETTGNSMRVEARLARATRENRNWVYILRWAGLPDIVVL